jgi:hypothetical protein
MQLESVRIPRNMALELRPPRKNNQHVPCRGLPSILLVHRRNTVLEIMIHKHERIQKPLMMHAYTDQCRVRLACLHPRRLRIVVHVRYCTVRPHIVAPQEHGHGVVGSIGVHALEGWFTEYPGALGCVRACVEHGAYPGGGVVVESGARRHWDAVEDERFEEHQGLHDGVALHVGGCFVEGPWYAGVMPLVVLLYCECVGLGFETPYAACFGIDTISAVGYRAIVQCWIRPGEIADLLDVFEVVFSRAETFEYGNHVLSSDQNKSIPQICSAKSHDGGYRFIESSIIALFEYV